MKKPLIVLTGPTAVGKTRLSISLAKAIGGEIISADSMQVYKYMDIGSAKIMPEEMQGVPHYLVDELTPEDEFHIVRFQQQDDGYRAGLEAIVQEKGAAYLHQMLAEVDPKSAEVIHENNTKRVIRALEFYHQNHSPISAHNEEQQERTSPYNLAYFVLNAPRELLYKRIDKRVDEMMTSGLVAEVQKLKDMGCHRGMVSMQGLGYKEILAYLDGEMSLEEAVRILKRDTRHFAKRQLTWFRREPETVWVNKDEFGYNEDKMLEYMLNVCHEKGITGE